MSYNRLRNGRHSEPGREYFITCVTHNRIRVFNNLSSARLVIQQLRRLDQDNHLRSQAWVLMPDHIHILATLGNDCSLSECIQQLKGCSTRIINGQQGAQHRSLWQQGFYDRALRHEEDRLAIAHYIVANPLRAGLVKRLADYPHWDSIWL
ncbi:MAG: putative transposase [Motiliproteus sp.]|jgi:putative transposase